MEDSQRRRPWRPLVLPTSTGRFLGTLTSNLTLQDAAVLGLNGFLCWKAAFAISGPGAEDVREQLFVLFTLALASVISMRGELLEPGPLRASFYRVGALGSMIGSYLTLRALLPALHPELLDARLVAIDRALFGQTPAVWLDQFANPHSVEWFAFFYYSYYFILGTYLIGTVLFDDGRRRYELLLGAALVAAVGHAGYTFVPGVGPWAYAELTFQHQLTGGPWWHRVLSAVTSAGAQMDIFPSLHTGFSLLCGLHALRWRRERPFRYTWLLTWFAVVNIIIATVFLRWHYAIDLIAGALLAFTAHRTAITVWRWEGQRELERGVQPVWEPILPPGLAGSERLRGAGMLTIQIVMMALFLTQCF
ncbi:MAG TPA: phosphatase PAP2 family protein [Polyangiales bacterium]|nr:phosphatase PAP2 family protein [Polyangiales bacterium]